MDSPGAALRCGRATRTRSCSGYLCFCRRCLPSSLSLPLRALLLHLAFDLRGNAAMRRAEFHRRAQRGERLVAGRVGAVPLGTGRRARLGAGLDLRRLAPGDLGAPIRAVQTAAVDAIKLAAALPAGAQSRFRPHKPDRQAYGCRLARPRRRPMGIDGLGLGVVVPAPFVQGPQQRRPQLADRRDVPELILAHGVHRQRGDMPPVKADLGTRDRFSSHYNVYRATAKKRPMPGASRTPRADDVVEVLAPQVGHSDGRFTENLPEIFVKDGAPAVGVAGAPFGEASRSGKWLAT